MVDLALICKSLTELNFDKKDLEYALDLGCMGKEEVRSIANKYR